MADYQPPPDQGLTVVFEDDHLLVLDKPSGLLSVPGRGERMADCLLSRARERFPDALVVHRLDMDTSGLILLARGPEMQQKLSALFMARRVHKAYQAVVHGLVAADRGEIDLPLIADWPRRPRQMVDHERGKPSLTRYQVLHRDPGGHYSRLALEPITGRSHQLRVHLMSIGHAICGDPLYGPDIVRAKASRLLLHASELSFPHPCIDQPLRLSCAAPF